MCVCVTQAKASPLHTEGLYDGAFGPWDLKKKRSVTHGFTVELSLSMLLKCVPKKCHNNTWNSSPCPPFYTSPSVCLSTFLCNLPYCPTSLFLQTRRSYLCSFLNKENRYLVSRRAFGYWRQWQTDVTWFHVSVVLNVRRRGRRQRCVGTIWWSLRAGGGGWERPQLWRRSGTDRGDEVIHHHHTWVTSCNSAP